ncbi:MAG: cohesin domain-containing protein [Candidatus Kryptoniota bacterium]
MRYQNRQYHLVRWVGWISFFIVVLSISARAEGTSGVVKPDPAVFEVGQGQVERLAIVLENAQDVYGVDIRARFDPTMVEIVDEDNQKEGVQMLPGQFPKPDFLVRNQADNTVGNLMYVITQVNPSPPANGNGVVFWIEMRGKVMGESPFVIEFVDAADREGKTLTLDKQNGTIRVVKPKPPTPTMIPTSNATDTPVAIATKPVKHKNTPKVVFTPTQTESATRTGWTSNQILIGVASGSFIGAALLFGYVFFKQRR